MSCGLCILNVSTTKHFTGTMPYKPVLLKRPTILFHANMVVCQAMAHELAQVPALEVRGDADATQLSQSLEISTAALLHPIMGLK